MVHLSFETGNKGPAGRERNLVAQAEAEGQRQAEHTDGHRMSIEGYNEENCAPTSINHHPR